MSSSTKAQQESPVATVQKDKDYEHYEKLIDEQKQLLSTCSTKALSSTTTGGTNLNDPSSMKVTTKSRQKKAAAAAGSAAAAAAATDVANSNMQNVSLTSTGKRIPSAKNALGYTSRPISEKSMADEKVRKQATTTTDSAQQQQASATRSRMMRTYKNTSSSSVNYRRTTRDGKLSKKMEEEHEQQQEQQQLEQEELAATTEDQQPESILDQFLQEHQYRQKLQDEQQELIAVCNNLKFLETKQKQQQHQQKSSSSATNNHSNNNSPALLSRHYYNQQLSSFSDVNSSSMILNNISNIENGGAGNAFGDETNGEKDGNNNTQQQNDDENAKAQQQVSATTTLVQQKLNSAKDRFYASARENLRLRQIQSEGLFASGGSEIAGAGGVSRGITRSGINNNTSFGNKNNENTDAVNNFSFDENSSSYSAGTTNHSYSVYTTRQEAANDPERRSLIVKSVLATSSVFNVNSVLSVDDVEHRHNVTTTVRTSNKRDASTTMMNEGRIRKKDGVIIVTSPSGDGGEETVMTVNNNNNNNQVALQQQQYSNDDEDTTLIFPGLRGKRTRLSVFHGDSEPMMQHIDKVRENALLAALEASRSRTANETRQADAAATLQSFFRMVVVRRRYLRQKLNVAKQLRAIDRLRCCKAAMMLSRFCRGHNVRKSYRIQRAELAAKRYDNLFRRSKIERSNTPGLQKVPPTHLIQGQNCTTEEWTLDVLVRFNVNFVNAMRAYYDGAWIECITFLEAHIKTSTVSAKEQSSEYLAEVLMRKVNDRLPPQIAQEMLSKQGGAGGRRRRF